MNTFARLCLCAFLVVPCAPALARQSAPPTPPTAAPAKKLYVIAPESLVPALTDFVKQKNASIPTVLVSLEKAMMGQAGADDPERLKRFLYKAWKEDSLGYALLVGDVDIMPVRYMVLDRITPAAFDYSFYPSDLYYADLAKQDGSFDDWNARKDEFHAGYFGEVRGEKNKTDAINFDDIDYRPDIAVGRWPVSTGAEVAIIAAKSIAYEKSILDKTHPGLRAAALFAVGGWVDSRVLMEHVSSKLPSGWTSDRRYYETPTPPPDEKQLLELINRGSSLVFHAGHGTDNTWEGCLSVNSIDAMKNADRLPIMISAGCSTAAFAPLGPYAPYVDVSGGAHTGTDKGEVFTAPPPPAAPYQRAEFNPSGLGEQLLKRGPNGAVAYIGCNTGSQPCGMTLMYGFAQALNTLPEPRLGDCWNGAINFYFTTEKLATLKPSKEWYPPSIFFQGMKFMVFGDPSLRLAAPGERGAPQTPIPIVKPGQ